MFLIAQRQIGTQIAIMRHALLIAAFVATAFPASARAASSAWLETDGGRVRLVTSGRPDDQGVFKGALQIDLKPGWKTYWRDPGGSGVPPTLDVSGSPDIASAELSFPPPQRFKDEYSNWAGYKHSVALPVKFITRASSQPARIEARVFLGVCKTICIPVQGQLVVDAGETPDDPEAATVVQAALAALPSPARPDFSASTVISEPGKLLIEAKLPSGARQVDLFVASEHGYMFGAPERLEKDSGALFSVPVLERPAAAPSEGALNYTLVTDAGSVEGTLPFP